MKNDDDKIIAMPSFSSEEILSAVGVEVGLQEDQEFEKSLEESTYKIFLEAIEDGELDFVKTRIVLNQTKVQYFINNYDFSSNDEMQDFWGKLSCLREKFSAGDGESLCEAILNNSANPECHSLAKRFKDESRKDIESKGFPPDDFLSGIESVLESGLKFFDPEEAGRGDRGKS